MTKKKEVVEKVTKNKVTESKKSEVKKETKISPEEKLVHQMPVFDEQPSTSEESTTSVEPTSEEQPKALTKPVKPPKKVNIWFVTGDGTVPEWTWRAIQEKKLPYTTRGNTAIMLLDNRATAKIGTLGRCTDRGTVVEMIMSVLTACKTLFEWDAPAFPIYEALQRVNIPSTKEEFSHLLKKGDRVVVISMKTGNKWTRFEII